MRRTEASPAKQNDAPLRLVVIGGSAGAIDPLQRLLGSLPGDLPVAILVALHLPSQQATHLASVISRLGVWPADLAGDGDVLRTGRVLVAPPDRHLTVEGDHVRVRWGPRENGNRPAIDPLFRSAAYHHGPRVLAIVLSGLLDDGSAGLAAVRRQGGVCVVQRPDDAQFGPMPENAIRRADPQHIVASEEIADLVVAFAGAPAPVVREPAGSPGPIPGSTDQEGRPTGFICPECQGVLWQPWDDDLAFVCRVGHRFAAESLTELNAARLDGSLWSAYRGLDEQASLCAVVAERMAAAGEVTKARHLRDRAAEARRRAQIMRVALGGGEAPPPD